MDLSPSTALLLCLDDPYLECFDLLGSLCSTSKSKHEQQTHILTVSWGAAGFGGRSGESLWCASAWLPCWYRHGQSHHLSAIHWSEECNHSRESLRNHWWPILLRVRDSKVSEAMTIFSLILGIFYSCKKQTVLCSKCLYKIPSFFCIWLL